MAFDLDGFLKDLGATSEEEAALRAALGKPERLSVLEKNQLRLSDYSKQMNDLGKAKTELETTKARLDAEAVEWATLSASEKAAATELRSSLEKLQARELMLTQRVQRIAADAGLDPAKALEGIDQAPPPKKDEPPPVDTSKFVDNERFGQLGNYLFTMATELPMLAQEHFELTGERLDTRALRTEIEKRAAVKGANLDPRAIWEDVHQIAAKRQAKDQAAREAEIKAAEQRGFERARTEAALPIAPSAGTRSPLLKAVDPATHPSKLNRPAPEQGVRSAAAALATGKYRQPTGATQ